MAAWSDAILAKRNLLGRWMLERRRMPEQEFVVRQQKVLEELQTFQAESASAEDRARSGRSRFGFQRPQFNLGSTTGSITSGSSTTFFLPANPVLWVSTYVTVPAMGVYSNTYGNYVKLGQSYAIVSSKSMDAQPPDGPNDPNSPFPPFMLYLGFDDIIPLQVDCSKYGIEAYASTTHRATWSILNSPPYVSTRTTSGTDQGNCPHVAPKAHFTMSGGGSDLSQLVLDAPATVALSADGTERDATVTAYSWTLKGVNAGTGYYSTIDATTGSNGVHLDVTDARGLRGAADGVILVKSLCWDLSATNYSGPAPCSYPAGGGGGSGSTTPPPSSPPPPPPVYVPPYYNPRPATRVCIIHGLNTDWEWEECWWVENNDARIPLAPGTLSAARSVVEPSQRAPTSLPSATDELRPSTSQGVAGSASLFLVVSDSLPADVQARLERHPAGPYKNVLLVHRVVTRSVLAWGLRTVYEHRKLHGESPAREYVTVLKGDAPSINFSLEEREAVSAIAMKMVNVPKGKFPKYGAVQYMEIVLGDMKAEKK